DRAPRAPAIALRAVDRYARIHREGRAALIGAYFSHHHLRAQAELSRELLSLCFHAPPAERSAACLRVHARHQEERRAWISALLEGCAAFNVGSLTDHEDVDIAVVVDSVDARASLDKAFAQVTKTFLRFASK